MSDVVHYALSLGLIVLPIILFLISALRGVSRVYEMQSMVLSAPFF